MQFELYTMEQYSCSKDEFYALFDLDKNKKIICFSCADVYWRNDPIFKELLMRF
jgi:hypothetical protein